MNKIKEIFKKLKRDKIYKAHLYSDGTEIIETVVKNNISFKRDNWQTLLIDMGIGNTIVKTGCLIYFSEKKIDFSNGYDILLYDSHSNFIVDGSLKLGCIAIENIHGGNKFDLTITVKKNG